MATAGYLRFVQGTARAPSLALPTNPPVNREGEWTKTETRHAGPQGWQSAEPNLARIDGDYVSGSLLMFHLQKSVPCSAKELLS